MKDAAIHIHIHICNDLCKQITTHYSKMPPKNYSQLNNTYICTSTTHWLIFIEIFVYKESNLYVNVVMFDLCIYSTSFRNDVVHAQWTVATHYRHFCLMILIKTDDGRTRLLSGIGKSGTVHSEAQRENISRKF